VALAYNQANKGEFQEVSQKHWFTYRETTNEWALRNGLGFEVDCGHGETRFAKILKTVLRLAIDEAADGSAVLEKWSIRNHSTFPMRAN
jgi:hypothetical protein